jgi:hypothetical protein
MHVSRPARITAVLAIAVAMSYLGEADLVLATEGPDR